MTTAKELDAAICAAMTEYHSASPQPKHLDQIIRKHLAGMTIPAPVDPLVELYAAYRSEAANITPEKTNMVSSDLSLNAFVAVVSDYIKRQP